MAVDLKCKSCSSENTQRLSVMRGQQSVRSAIGSGQTALAAALKEPKKFWAYALGFMAAACTVPMVWALSGSSVNSALPGLVFLCVWLGMGYWINSNYQIRLEAWEDYLHEHFICLRCGNVFSAHTATGQGKTPLWEEHQARPAAKERIRNRQLGFAVHH